jgi:hypothetical protein
MLLKHVKYMRLEVSSRHTFPSMFLFVFIYEFEMSEALLVQCLCIYYIHRSVLLLKFSVSLYVQVLFSYILTELPYIFTEAVELLNNFIWNS